MGAEGAEPTEQFQAEMDDAYRAVGRYVVEFSRLVFWMRRIISERLEGSRRSGIPTFAELAFGEATASQIANSFFAMCREDAGFDKGEEEVARVLSREVNAAMQRRNDLAHGDWWIGWGSPGQSMADPAIERTKPTRRSGATVRTDVPSAELDRWSATLATLRTHVAEFGSIALQQNIFSPDTQVNISKRPVLVRDVFSVIDGKVARKKRPLRGAARVFYP